MTKKSFIIILSTVLSGLTLSGCQSGGGSDSENVESAGSVVSIKPYAVLPQKITEKKSSYQFNDVVVSSPKSIGAIGDSGGQTVRLADVKWDNLAQDQVQWFHDPHVSADKYCFDEKGQGKVFKADGTCYLNLRIKPSQAGEAVNGQLKLYLIGATQPSIIVPVQTQVVSPKDLPEYMSLNTMINTLPKLVMQLQLQNNAQNVDIQGATIDLTNMPDDLFALINKDSLAGTEAHWESENSKIIELPILIRAGAQQSVSLKLNDHDALSLLSKYANDLQTNKGKDQSLPMIQVVASNEKLKDNTIKLNSAKAVVENKQIVVYKRQPSITNVAIKNASDIAWKLPHNISSAFEVNASDPSRASSLSVVEPTGEKANQSCIDKGDLLKGGSCYIAVKLNDPKMDSSVKYNLSIKPHQNMLFTSSTPISLEQGPSSKMILQGNINFVPNGEVHFKLQNDSDYDITHAMIDLSNMPDDLFDIIKIDSLQHGSWDTENKSKIIFSIPANSKVDVSFKLADQEAIAVLRKYYRNLVENQIDVSAKKDRKINVEERLSYNQTVPLIQVYADNADHVDLHDKIKVAMDPVSFDGLDIDTPSAKSMRFVNHTQADITIDQIKVNSLPHGVSYHTPTSNECKEGMVIKSNEGCYVVYSLGQNAWSEHNQKLENPVVIDYVSDGKSYSTASLHPAPYIKVDPVNIKIINDNIIVDKGTEKSSNYTNIAIENTGKFNWQLPDRLDNVFSIEQTSSSYPVDLSIVTPKNLSEGEMACENGQVTPEGRCIIAIKSESSNIDDSAQYVLRVKAYKNVNVDTTKNFSINGALSFGISHEKWTTYPAVKSIKLTNLSDKAQSFKVDFADSHKYFNIYNESADDKVCDRVHCRNSCFTQGQDTSKEATLGDGQSCYVYVYGNQKDLEKPYQSKLVVHYDKDKKNGSDYQYTRAFTLKNNTLLYESLYSANSGAKLVVYKNKDWRGLEIQDGDGNSIRDIITDYLGQLFLAVSDGITWRYNDTIAREPQELDNLGNMNLAIGPNNLLYAVGIGSIIRKYIDDPKEDKATSAQIWSEAQDKQQRGEKWYWPYLGEITVDGQGRIYYRLIQQLYQPEPGFQYLFSIGQISPSELNEYHAVYYDMSSTSWDVEMDQLITGPDNNIYTSAWNGDDHQNPYVLKLDTREGKINQTWLQGSAVMPETHQRTPSEVIFDPKTKDLYYHFQFTWDDGTADHHLIKIKSQDVVNDEPKFEDVTSNLSALKPYTLRLFFDDNALYAVKNNFTGGQAIYKHLDDDSWQLIDQDDSGLIPEKSYVSKVVVGNDLSITEAGV